MKKVLWPDFAPSRLTWALIVMSQRISVLFCFFLFAFASALILAWCSYLSRSRYISASYSATGSPPSCSMIPCLFVYFSWMGVAFNLALVLYSEFSSFSLALFRSIPPGRAKFVLPVKVFEAMGEVVSY